MALKAKNRIKLSRKEKDGASPKSKGFKAAKGSRFVLLVGDEGAILVHINGNNVISRQYVPDTSQPHLDELKETLLKDPKAPIMLVVDSMDQTYAQHTLPPVSKLNVNKLIKQRLDRDFAADVIKGALVLGRDEKGRRDWNFLTISVEKSAHFTIWLEFSQAQTNRFLGIYLVAVECETIVKNLERAMNLPKTETTAQWKFFVSHNKVGGFRQVMLRNGRMVFTRLAQPLAESKPEVIAGNIEQEILNTIEYMKRLSYNPADGLDVYILASSGIKEAIDGSKFEARGCHVLTPYEVAQYFKIEGATQPTDQFGDVILAASIGCSTQHTLKFTTPVSQQLDQYYQLFTYQRAATALIALCILGYAGYVGFDVYTYSGEIETLTRSKATTQQDKEALDRDIKQSNLDINKVSEMLDYYQLITQEKLSPIPILATIQPLTRLPVKIKELQWRLDVPPPPPGAGDAPVQLGKGPNKVDATLTLEFTSPASNLNRLRQTSREVLDAYRKALPGYDINYANLPAEMQEDSRVQIDFKADDSAKAEPDKVFTVQMMIKGNAVPAPAVAAAAPAAAPAATGTP